MFVLQVEVVLEVDSIKPVSFSEPSTACALTPGQVGQFEEEDIGDPAHIPPTVISAVDSPMAISHLDLPTSELPKDEDVVNAKDLVAFGGIIPFEPSTKQGTQLSARRELMRSSPTHGLKPRPIHSRGTPGLSRAAGKRKKRDEIDDIFGF